MSRAEDVKFLPPLAEEDKMLAGVCYPAWLVVPAFVLLTPKKNDPYVCFHAVQAVMLGVYSSLAQLFLLLAVWIFFQIVPKSGTTLSGVVGVAMFSSGLLVSLVLFLLAFFMGWRAALGHYLKLPGIGGWSERVMAKTLHMDRAAMIEAASTRSLKVGPAKSVPQQPIFPEDFDAEAAKAYVHKMFPTQQKAVVPEAAPPQEPAQKAWSSARPPGLEGTPDRLPEPSRIGEVPPLRGAASELPAARMGPASGTLSGVRNPVVPPAKTAATQPPVRPSAPAAHSSAPARPAAGSARPTAPAPRPPQAPSSVKPTAGLTPKPPMVNPGGSSAASSRPTGGLPSPYTPHPGAPKPVAPTPPAKPTDAAARWAARGDS